MYKTAARKKFRFPAPQGLVTTEQLWDLNTSTLNSIAVELDEQIKTTKKKSFLKNSLLDKEDQKNEELKLRLEIVVDILQTKESEEEAAANAAAVKRQNNKLLSIIESKKEKELETLTVEELEKRLIK